MPTSNELVGSEPIVVLKDTCLSGVIVKKNLVKEEQLTGKVGYVMTLARTILKALFAIVEVSTSISVEQWKLGAKKIRCMS